MRKTLQTFLPRWLRPTSSVARRLREFLSPKNHVHGRFRWCTIDDGRWVPQTEWRSNLVLYDWAPIVCQLLSGQAQYKLGAMYLEFENVANPEDPVSPPALSRSAGRSYYESLSGNPSRDYLRVPIHSITLSSNNQSNFPSGNVLTIQAQTAGNVGQNGLDFGYAHNSKLFGAGLVSTPSYSDASQDLVLSRFYSEVSDQRLVDPTGQVGAMWELELG